MRLLHAVAIVALVGRVRALPVGDSAAHDLAEAWRHLLSAPPQAHSARSAPTASASASAWQRRKERLGEPLRIGQKEIRAIVTSHAHLPDPGLLSSKRQSVKAASTFKQRQLKSGNSTPRAWERQRRARDVPIPGFTREHWMAMDNYRRKYATKTYYQLRAGEMNGQDGARVGRQKGAREEGHSDHAQRSPPSPRSEGPSHSAEEDGSALELQREIEALLADSP